MKLKQLRIKNFRGLSDIDVKFDRDVSVIVGPNAIGKTSILEAIRLTKALLAPRYTAEPQLTLADMGAFVVDRIVYRSLAGDTSQPLEIKLQFELSEDEIVALENDIQSLAVLHTRNVSGIQSGLPDFAIAQFLSSPQGRAIVARSTAEVTGRVSELRKTNRISLALTIDPTVAAPQGADLFAHEFVIALEKRLSPSKAYFAYFPADRAMPSGEVGIQLGSADAQAQLHSHIAQPATKYNRLKNVIVGQTLSGDAERKALTADFEIIFDELLVGKKLVGLEVSDRGPLTVLIQDVDTKKIYDIDRMSSGEKGLILQFLLMRRSLTEGGLILLDEPELHLNPLICKRLVSFIVRNIVEPGKAQALICTHSPEVLADAFDRIGCRLFHLRSGTDLSRIYKEDKEQIFDALKRLGATTADVLFSRGTIFVEGPHDADILEQGFSSRISGYKIKQLRGRKEIEKEIQTLQDAERAGKLKDPQILLFDRDRQALQIPSSNLVKVHQWERYCLENFLLDPDAVFDVLTETNAGNRPASRGDASALLKKFAFDQLEVVAAQETYATFEPDNPGLRPSEISASPSLEETGKLLHARLIRIQTQISGLSEAQWVQQFIDKCKTRAQELRAIWEDKWMMECDGKRVLMEFHKHSKPTFSLLEFKRKIVGAMAKRPTDNWRIVDSSLGELVSSE
jgi:predicted ATPase